MRWGKSPFDSPMTSLNLDSTFLTKSFVSRNFFHLHTLGHMTHEGKRSIRVVCFIFGGLTRKKNCLNFLPLVNSYGIGSSSIRWAIHLYPKGLKIRQKEYVRCQSSPHEKKRIETVEFPSDTPTYYIRYYCLFLAIFNFINKFHYTAAFKKAFVSW